MTPRFSSTSLALLFAVGCRGSGHASAQTGEPKQYASHDFTLILPADATVHEIQSPGPREIAISSSDDSSYTMFIAHLDVPDTASLRVLVRRAFINDSIESKANGWG